MTKDCRARQGPERCEGRPQGGQQRGEGSVMKAAQLQGLQSDALGISTMREGCPLQPFRQLRASDLALGEPRGLSCPCKSVLHAQDQHEVHITPSIRLLHHVLIS